MGRVGGAEVGICSGGPAAGQRQPDTTLRIKKKHR
jgi:hypothetical protein